MASVGRRAAAAVAETVAAAAADTSEYKRERAIASAQFVCGDSSTTKRKYSRASIMSASARAVRSHDAKETFFYSQIGAFAVF